ncbi:serine hydrolase [Microtetraspora malaysiensis]|uniref:serine hydrolase n=1 Tax=Microtetraspora malaysiensis TaxID=161358 RepID=UPI003D8C72EC
MGLGDYYGLPGFWDAARTWTRRAGISRPRTHGPVRTSVRQVKDGIGEFVRKERPAFSPGAGNACSDSACHLLGEIAAWVSGHPFHGFVREHVCRAAGKSGADFSTVPQWREDRRIARSYSRPPRSAGRADSLDERIFVDGAFATCAEMERFVHALGSPTLSDHQRPARHADLRPLEHRGPAPHP